MAKKKVDVTNVIVALLVMITLLLGGIFLSLNPCGVLGKGFCAWKKKLTLCPYGKKGKDDSSKKGSRSRR